MRISKITVKSKSVKNKNTSAATSVQNKMNENKIQNKISRNSQLEKLKKK